MNPSIRLAVLDDMHVRLCPQQSGGDVRPAVLDSGGGLLDQFRGVEGDSSDPAISAYGRWIHLRLGCGRADHSGQQQVADVFLTRMW